MAGPDGRSRPVSAMYRVDVLPGYKSGTKITYPATSAFPRKVVFELVEKEDPRFRISRRNADDVELRKPILVPKADLESCQAQAHSREEGNPQIIVRVPLLCGGEKECALDEADVRLLLRRSGAQCSKRIPREGMPIRSTKLTKDVGAKWGDLVFTVQSGR